jgi:hypothetical protein
MIISSRSFQIINQNAGQQKQQHYVSENLKVALCIILICKILIFVPDFMLTTSKLM